MREIHTIRDVAVWMYIRARFLLAFCCGKRDVPGEIIRDLRDLTRMRASLSQEGIPCPPFYLELGRYSESSFVFERCRIAASMQLPDCDYRLVKKADKLLRHRAWDSRLHV